MNFRLINSLLIGLVLFAGGCDRGVAPPPPGFQYDTLTADQVLTFDGVTFEGNPVIGTEGKEHSLRVSMRILDARLRAKNVKWRFHIIGFNVNGRKKMVVAFRPATIKPDPDCTDCVVIEGGVQLSDVRPGSYQIRIYVDTGSEMFELGGWPLLVDPSSEPQPEQTPVQIQDGTPPMP